MHEMIGLLGSLLFAVCSWPLAYDSFKRRTAAGIQWSFVIIWFLAAVFSAVYAIGVPFAALDHVFKIVANASDADVSRDR